MNHKRKHPRRKVKCTLCTDARNGNSKAPGNFGSSPAKAIKRHFDWRKDQGV